MPELLTHAEAIEEIRQRLASRDYQLPRPFGYSGADFMQEIRTILSRVSTEEEAQRGHAKDEALSVLRDFVTVVQSLGLMNSFAVADALKAINSLERDPRCAEPRQESVEEIRNWLDEILAGTGAALEPYQSSKVARAVLARFGAMSDKRTVRELRRSLEEIFGDAPTLIAFTQRIAEELEEIALQLDDRSENEIVKAEELRALAKEVRGD